MVYFYALTYDTEFNPNMVFYVGKTVSKEQRLSGHKATFGKNCVLHQIDFLDQYSSMTSFSLLLESSIGLLIFAR